MTLRLGLIDYLNPAPFYWDLRQRLGNDTSFAADVPSQLNQALLEGRLDAAIVSSHFAIQHADRFLIVPNASVSARGAVRSVLLLSWAQELRDLGGKDIALTSSSSSSVCLLRLLLEEACSEPPRYRSVSPDPAAMLASAEAALIIGGGALSEWVERREIAHPSGGLQRPVLHDLADEWLRWTGLPFTFAVWAVRREVAEDLRALRFTDHLHASLAGGLANLPELARRAAPGLGLAEEECLTYLQNLEYGLEGEFLEGLQEFARRAFPAPATPRLEFL